jgi:anti-anti-sigma factor
MVSTRSSPSTRQQPLGTINASTVNEGDVVVVRLLGEYDHGTGPALAEVLASAIGDTAADLVVDLSGVEFMDSSTVLLLDRLRDYLALQSRAFALRAPSSAARRILDLCDAGGLLVFERDVFDPGKVTFLPQ